MKKFTLMGNTFRILKGGKIGLASAIALIGGTLMLSSINANAETYFTGNVSSSAITDGGYTVYKYSASTTNTNTRTDAVIEDVVFAPYGVADTYIGVDDVDNGSVAGIFGQSSTAYDEPIPTGVYQDILAGAGESYYVKANGTFTPSDGGSPVTVTGVNDVSSQTNTLIFSAGSNAFDIYKAAGTNYYIDGSTNPDLGYGTTSGGTSYTANLIFQGTNLVSGYTDIDGGYIDINGGVTFAGTVDAGSINIGTSSLVTFNSYVDLYNGGVNPNNITFYNGGNVVLNGGLDGNIDFNSYNATVSLSNGNIWGDVFTDTQDSGTLVLSSGSGSTIYGSVGTTDYNLKEIVVDGTADYYLGDSTGEDTFTNLITYNSAGTVIVSGDLDTTRTDSSIGTVDFSAYDGNLVAEGDVTAHFVTDLNNNGNLYMDGFASQSITSGSTVGADGFALNSVNIGQDSTTTANQDIYADTINLNTSYWGDTQNVSNSELIMAAGYDINGIVTTGVDSFGILNLEGGEQNVTGTVGANTLRLNTIYSGEDASTSTFENNVYTDNFINVGNGTTEFDANLTATNSIIATNSGTINVDGAVTMNPYNNTTTSAYLLLDNDSNMTISNSIDLLNTTALSVTGDVDATISVLDGSQLTVSTGSVEIISNLNNASLNVINGDNPDEDTLMTISNGNLLIDAENSAYLTVEGGPIKYAKLDVNGNVAVNAYWDNAIFTTNFASSDIAGSLSVDGEDSAVINVTNYSSLDVGSDVDVLATINYNGNSTVNISNYSEMNVGGSLSVDADELVNLNVISNSSLDVTGNVSLYSDDNTITVNIDNSSLSVGDFVSVEAGFDGDAYVNITNNSNTTIDGSLSIYAPYSSKLYVNDSTLSVNSLGEDSTGLNISSNVDEATAEVYSSSLTVNDGDMRITSNLDFAGMIIQSDFDGEDSNVTISNGDLYIASNDMTYYNYNAELTVNGNSYTASLNVSGNVDVISSGEDSTVNLTDSTTTIGGDLNVTALDDSTINMDNSTATVDGSLTVTATNFDAYVNVNNNSTLTVDGDVTADLVTVGAGSTVNFNATTDALSTTDIEFTSDSALANLDGNLTGNIYFNNNDAQVDLANGKTIDGSLYSSDNWYGYIDFEGSGTITGETFVYGINVGTLVQGTANFNGDTIGEDGINLFNDSTIVMAENTNIGIDSDNSGSGVDGQSNISTNINNTGTLTLEGGVQEVYGQIGSYGYSLKEVNIGTVSTPTTTFDNMVYATDVNVGEDYSVINFNGQNYDGNANADALNGTLNLNSTMSTVNIAGGLNLTTGEDGISFTNANNSSLVFEGSSTVYGQLGGDSLTNDTFETIYAQGTTFDSLTFKNDVYVEEGTVMAPTTFHVDGTGTVNFEGNLYGDLVFNQDGIVNVSDTKSVVVTGEDSLAIYTDTDDQGIVNFLGSTTLYSDLAESGSMLEAVNFNTETNGVTQEIGTNVYAYDTTIGHANGEDSIALNLVDVTAEYDFEGADNIQEFRGQTAVNITSDVEFGGNLTIADSTSAINIGTSHVTVNGQFTTNNGGLSFIVNTLDLTGSDNADSTSTGSGLVTTDTLAMVGDEQIHINYVGSLSDAGSYTLIDALTNTTLENDGTDFTVTDNSSIIDTIVDLDINGDLVVTADRTGGGDYTSDELYIEKSNTQGNFSNGAATVLAGIAADGSQTGDMIEVIQKLELDSFGYGNTAENLADQLELAAPVANSANLQTIVNTANLVANTINSRTADIRANTANGLSSGNEVMGDSSAWIKGIYTKSSQDSNAQYDGYDAKAYGAVIGIDKTTSSGTTFGLAVSFNSSDVDLEGLRTGDNIDTDTKEVIAYVSKDYQNAYIDAQISYAMHDTSSTRQTAIDRTAKANIDATQLGAKVEAGYKALTSNGTAITPYFALGYSFLEQDAYNETGADALNLNVDALDLNRGLAQVGVKFAKAFDSNGTIYTPSLNLGAYTTFGDDNVDVVAQFAGGGDKFITPTQDLNETVFKIGAGLKTDFANNSNISLDLNYETNDNSEFNSYSGSIKYQIKF